MAKLSIAVLEPTWDGIAHLPGNLGLLRVVCGAYPNATVHFVGGQSQITMLKDIAPTDVSDSVVFTSWLPSSDKDTLPTDVFRAVQKLRRLKIFGVDLIVLSSCTATVLSALCWLGLAHKTCAMLHGNANDLTGWRSRNPLRRSFDFSASLKRFAAQGGKVTVLEDRISHQLSQQNPWLARSLVVLPHPLLPEEARPPGSPKLLSKPIKIGFAGLATVAKGFPDFLEFARQLESKHPDVFEFHAFGKLHKECANFDQTVLKTRANEGLDRTAFVAGLNSLHYLFVWHQDNYYGNAASGVVYDAINLGIPMIARRCAQISDWEAQGLDIANSFEDLSSAIHRLASFDIDLETQHYIKQCADLVFLRASLSLPKLSEIFANHFPLVRHN